jgi:hemolysin activation/secretion protein
VLGALVGLLLGPAAWAQQPPPRAAERITGGGALDRPGSRRLELPAPEAPGEAPEVTLPPLPELSESERQRLSSGPRVVVKEFRVTGSTVFTPEQIAAVTAPYLGRPVGSEDLQELRDRLTLLYVDEGYLNSGALLPDQDASGGVIEYQIVEGRLTEIEIAGEGRFRHSYLRDRLALGAGTPLNVRSLENRLQILQQDPRIARVNAELGPGALPGEGVLRVRFEEERPWTADFEFSNYQSPSIGSLRGDVILSHQNLTGSGDALRTSWGHTRGFDEWELGYEIPVTPRDTTVGFRYRYSESEIVESPFDDLDIESASWTAALGVRQPVQRSLRSAVDLFLVGELRESRTYLLDERFTFTEGPENGKAQVSVLRLGSDWVWRDPSQVVAMRSTFSAGLDLFNATVRGGEIPDGQFLAWLGQFQWARRFDRLLGIQTVFRTDCQLANSALLSLEQFAVGGMRSVRGYRENELVRDNGLVSSIELRIPLYTAPENRFVLQLAPFSDIGRSWNTDRGELSPQTLYSAGVGLRTSIALWGRRLEGEIYWAEDLRDVQEPSDRDLQDTGVHFRVGLSL